MKTITIIAEQISEKSLFAILPTSGNSSVTVIEDPSVKPNGESRSNVHAFRNPARFNPKYRIDLTVDEALVDAVLDSISVAYGAGYFSDAEAWVRVPALTPAA